MGLGNPCHIATKTPLEKLNQNLGLADPHPPQLGQKTKFFDRFNLRAPLISPSGSPSAFHDFYDSFDYDEEDWDVWESEPTDSEVGEEEEVDGQHHEEEKGEKEEVMDQSRMEEKQGETQEKDIS